MLKLKKLQISGLIIITAFWLVLFILILIRLFSHVNPDSAQDEQFDEEWDRAAAVLENPNSMRLDFVGATLPVPLPRPQQLPNNLDLHQYTNEELIDHLKNHHLTPPAAMDKPYNLSGSVSYPSFEEHDQYHRDLLGILKTHHKIETGFFVEAGALDGHFLSHSLELEMEHGWNGLLVEASPSLTGQLRSKNRKCWSADVCLTGDPYMKIDYIAKKDQAALWKRGNGKINPVKSGVTPRIFEGQQEYRSEGEVECFSLYSLLTALNIQVVDLLVLDIEGHEFQVLSTYPYDRIPIKVIAVEHWLLPMPSSKLKEFLLQKGYDLVYESTSDYVFVLKTGAEHFR